MSVRTTWYTEDNKIGVDLNNPEPAISVTTKPELPANKINLGEEVQGIAGSRWMYVVASATVSTQNLVAISPVTSTEFHAESLTSAHVISAIYTIGISQLAVTAAATGEGFWALLEARSGAVINSVGSCLAGAQLYLSSSGAGHITTSVSTAILYGMVAVNPATATTATMDVAMSRAITASV
jgi:hypothetical protein